MATDNVLDQLLKESSKAEEDSFEQEDQVLAPLLEEINLIQDQSIRFFVRALLLQASDFWVIPASFGSEQNHPPDEASTGGNVLHTKRVVRLVSFICESQDRTNVDTDYLLAAAILHDLTKGIKWEDGTMHYDPMHPYTVDRILDEAMMEDSKHAASPYFTRSTAMLLDGEAIAQILRLIRCHLGLYSPIPETYPLTTMDWTLHLADFLASKLHFIIDGEDIKPWRWIDLDEPDIS